MIKFLTNPKTPTIIFSSLAYSKMITALKIKKVNLLEFMFLGDVIKENETTFLIEDINFAPQIAKGVTVETDDDKYPQWLLETYKTPTQRKKIRLHGHSHVNMGTTPSGVDVSLINNLINNVSDFFIQLIINKKGEYTLNLFDKERNIIFENEPMYLKIKNFNIKLASNDFNKSIFLLPNDFILQNYTCTINGNILFIGDDIALDTLKLEYYVEDENIQVKGSKILLLKEESLFEELTKDLNDKVSTYTTSYYNSATSPYTGDYDSFNKEYEDFADSSTVYYKIGDQLINKQTGQVIYNQEKAKAHKKKGTH